MADWLKNDKSVLDVFNLLKLSDDGYLALRSRMLEVLKDYIKKFNLKTSGSESLVTVMTKGFGGESNLVHVLTTAKTDPFTASQARELETTLLTNWKNEKLSPLSLWSRLKFGKSVDDALSSGKVGAFYTYVIQNNPGSEQLVLQRFAAKYGEVEVTKALVTAKRSTVMEDIATKLQTQQLEHWLNLEKSADDVFTLLKIKNDGQHVLFLTNWKTETLKEYIKLFNFKHPQNKTNLFRVIRNGFAEDGDLARIVTRAMVTVDPQVRSTASKYKKALFKEWADSNIKPETIYTRVLNVEEASAGTLEKTIVRHYTRYYDKKITPPRRS